MRRTGAIWWSGMLDVRERLTIAGCAVRVIGADGIVTHDERHAYDALLRSLGLALRDGAAREVLAALEDARLHEDPRRTREVVRWMAYAAAAWAAHADGVVVDAEHRVLTDLAERLGLPARVVAQIWGHVQAHERAGDPGAEGIETWRADADRVLGMVLRELAATLRRSEHARDSQPARVPCDAGQDDE